jgi:alkanesulfonate monooxygenase SsuD/methylene tetrahydromethanopterin reductase-like flavin-dependent oxidoreductase (luciferase family)
MSKGSGRRPSSLTQDEWDNRWDAIFGRDQPKLKVVFAEGCFDGFEGSPDELAEMIAEIHKMAADGTIMHDARPLTDEEIAELNNIKREPRQ